MQSSSSDTAASSAMSPLVSSSLRLGGVLVFVTGCIASANLFAYGVGWPWLVLAIAVTLSGMIAMAAGLRGELMAGRKRLTTPERSRLRFDQWHGLWVFGYVFSFIVALTLAPGLDNGVARSALIAAPLAFFAVMVFEFVRMIVKSDEHQRGQHITASAISAGALIVAAGGWSTLSELIGGAPQPPGWALLPAFSVLYVLALSIMNREDA